MCINFWYWKVYKCINPLEQRIFSLKINPVTTMTASVFVMYSVQYLQTSVQVQYEISWAGLLVGGGFTP